MSVISASQLLMGDEGGYTISRSVRLRSSASAYFNRTFGTPTNANKWTWNGWIKLGALTGYQCFFFAGTSGSAYGGIWFNSGTLVISSYNGSGYPYNVTSVPVYRDPSAWYMVTIVYDSTQATNTNRIQMWVNNQQVTSFTSPTWPTQNTSYQINTAVQHNIGNGNVAGAGYFDGYLTEVNFIDGQALTPSSFGENDATTGVWKPKRYTGTYGTNGFYLNFSDNSNNTAATIGKDSSGNGNNWTPNNISVTAGATYDSMTDVPTLWGDGGNGRGNYAVMNPLEVLNSTVSDGNLKVVVSPTGGGITASTFVLTSGKWYAEALYSATAGGNAIAVGIGPGGTYQPNVLGAVGVAYYADGTKYVSGVNSAYGSSWTVNDTIGVALDADAGTVTFYKNNVSQGSITLPTSTTGWKLILQNGGGATTKTFVMTFGQNPFTYTPPTGFQALNTQNLPAPTIKKGNAYFDATTYTGTGSSLSITNSGSMQPDLVWIKGRSGATDHALYDAVRGTTLDLVSNSSAAETTQATGLTAFNSSGFTVGSLAKLNTNTSTYVGWQWKKGATPGFDIVTYTGNGSNRTIAHSLGVQPSWIIVRNRTAGGSWWNYHASLGATKAVRWDDTAAAGSYPTIWNNTAPTSSVFSVGTSGDVNGNTNNMVAYLFSEVAGFSKFGSYTGTNTSDGPFVYCGFRPRWVMVKSISTGGSATYGWAIFDTARESYNINRSMLQAEVSSAEDNTINADFDILSNGFKPRYSPNQTNGANTYIFAAFAENPFKYSLAR